MTAQPELALFRAAPTDPNVAWLVELLDQVRDWMTARQIATASAGRLDDRQIRMLAAAAAPEVISGQRGYRHIRHGTAGEIDHAAAWLRAQAREMLRRSIAIRRRAHELVG